MNFIPIHVILFTFAQLEIDFNNECCSSRMKFVLIESLPQLIRISNHIDSSELCFTKNLFLLLAVSEYLNSYLKSGEIKKMILLAPAFNQYELHRCKEYTQTDFQEYLNSKPIGFCKSY